MNLLDDCHNIYNILKELANRGCQYKENGIYVEKNKK